MRNVRVRTQAPTNARKRIFSNVRRESEEGKRIQTIKNNQMKFGYCTKSKKEKERGIEKEREKSIEEKTNRKHMMRESFH